MTLFTSSTDDDPNVNIYRAGWSQEARDRYGYAKESKKQVIERLSRCTSEAGKREYRRVSGIKEIK